MPRVEDIFYPTSVVKSAPARTSDGLEAVMTNGASDAQIATNSGYIQYAYQSALNGATWDRIRTPNKFVDIPGISITAGTPATVWSPAAGKKFRLMGFHISHSAGGNFIFKDAAAIAFRTGAVGANTPIFPSPMGNGFLSAAVNNALLVDTNTTGTLLGFVFGTEE